MDNIHTPQTIHTPTDAPKISNEKCLTNCQSVGYAKKRKKEGRNEEEKVKKVKLKF